MDAFVILIVGFAVQVKSDVGYQYKVPITSYEAPFGSVGNLNLNNERRKYDFDFQSENTIPMTPATVLQTPIREHVPFAGSSGLTQTEVPFGTNNRNLKITDNVVDAQRSFANDNSRQIEVQKHLYFFSAPDEIEEIKPRIITPPPTKKNVKILFIKTPSYKTAPINIPSLPQNEEKTLVYVLVKKPEESTIILPTSPPNKPTKPEVYFIKYKTQKEAEDAISNLQDGSSASQDVDGFSNVNLENKVLSSTEGVSSLPTIVTTSSPVNEISSFNTLRNQNELAGFQKQEFSGRIFSSADAITNFEKDNGFSSTTISPFGQTLGTVHGHQVYGPPKNRRQVF